MQEWLKNNFKKILLLNLIVLSVAALLFLRHFDEPHLRIDFLNIGQGDSFLITTPQGFQILVDGGPSPVVLEEIKKVMPLGDNDLDWLVLSHPDFDHLSGFIEILQNYKVDLAIMPDIKKDSLTYKTFLKLLDQKNIEKKFIMSEQEIKLEENLILTILHPSHKTFNQEMPANNASIVFRLDYRNMCMLFTGDIEMEVEVSLARYLGENLECEILKVPHHGSRSSSTKEFIDLVNPKVAWIQVGKDNKFGHPHNRVLYRFNDRGVKTFRTDELGSMHFSTDGSSLYQVFPRFIILDKLLGYVKRRVYTIDEY